MKKLLVVLTLFLVAAACGSNDNPAVEGAGPSAAGGSGHNDADVTFAQGMIPHHEQAVEMAEIVIEKGADSQVKALAERIKDAQAPEIVTMRGWLQEWGEPTTPEHGGDAGHDGGMLSEDELAQLSLLSGPALDKKFLESMIVHHEGAIEMAETEVADGEFGDAKMLAKRIIETQQQEIDEMRQLLEPGAQP